VDGSIVGLYLFATMAVGIVVRKHVANEHWFWWLTTLAVLVWYSTVTIYVAVNGTLDIRQMLRRLKEGEKVRDKR